MIRRRASNEFLLITQNDHAIFSGFLAGHVGNDRFEAPSPDVIAAIAAHDAGWALHDDQPTLNKNGHPLHVFETPLALVTRIWSASAERAVSLGPYAALLVSVHQLALSDVARQHQESNTHGAPSPRDVFDLNKFQHRQIEHQEALRQQIGLRTDLPLKLGLAAPGIDEAEGRLRFDFRLLTLCDRLSLQLCCGELLFPSIEEVLPAPGAAPVAVHTRITEETRLVVDPWPFDAGRLVAEVPFRRVPAEAFASQEAFGSTYEAARVERMQFEIVPTPRAGASG